MGTRWRPLIPAATLLYLTALIVLLLAPLGIVRYHSGFWQLMGRHLGTGWTLGRERALDDVVNVALFVPLGFLMHRWWRRGSSPSRATVGLTLAFVALLAPGIELAQFFLPWRHASIADVVTDVLGAAAGVAFDSVLARRRSRKPPGAAAPDRQGCVSP